MIRDKRTFIIINAVGVACALSLLFSHLAHPSIHAVFPRWFSLAIDVLLLAAFAYNIVLRLRGPIQPARWARNMTDRQLWIFKGVLMAIVIVLAIVPFVVVAFHLPRWIIGGMVTLPLTITVIFLSVVIVFSFRNRAT